MIGLAVFIVYAIGAEIRRLRRQRLEREVAALKARVERLERHD
jgi:hypothetical protein